MICYAGAGVFVKLSGLFVRWIFLMMSMTCKFCGSNGVVPASSKLNLTKEAFHGPNCVKGCRKNLPFLLFIGFVSFLSIWFLSRLDTGAFWGNKKAPDSCEKNAKIFLQHFNVSNNQLHALANLFSASDQVLLIFLQLHISFYISSGMSPLLVLIWSTCLCSKISRFDLRSMKNMHNFMEILLCA